jgi:hypothetical protein
MNTKTSFEERMEKMENMLVYLVEEVVSIHVELKAFRAEFNDCRESIREGGVLLSKM